MSYEILAKLTTTHSNIDEVRKALHLLMKQTQHEEGCRVFSVKESEGDDGVFYLWESWNNKASLDAHFEQTHTQHYLSLGFTDVTDYQVLKVLPNE